MPPSGSVSRNRLPSRAMRASRMSSMTRASPSGSIRQVTASGLPSGCRDLTTQAPGQTAAAFGACADSRRQDTGLFSSGNPQPVDHRAARGVLAAFPLRLQLLLQAIDEPVDEQPATGHRQAHPLRLAGAAGEQPLQELLLLEKGARGPVGEVQLAHRPPPLWYRRPR